MRTRETTISSPARLDRVVQQLTGLSRAGVRGLLDHQCVRVNGCAASLPQAQVSAGDVVRIEFDPHRKYKEIPRAEPDPAYRILHEDDDLIVVDKAAHILTVPTASGKGKTLIEALERHVNRGKPAALWKRLHVVHRLDQGVSGALVIARNAKTARLLKEQFAAHKPQRIYVAIVNGTIEQKRGTFRSFLATDYSLNRFSTRKPGEGELAITHYEVIEAGSRSGAPPFTVVRVQLETGRRNQIRVHFAEAGHPILGDQRYPRDIAGASDITSAHPAWRARRVGLHALRLEFTHPATGAHMRFEAALPAELRRLMSPAALRALGDEPSNASTRPAGAPSGARRRRNRP